jgi:hypothetical protein
MSSSSPAPLARLVLPEWVRSALPTTRLQGLAGSALISSHSPAGKRAGKSLRAKVIIWSFQLGQWLRGEVEKRGREREMKEATRREEWRLHMARTVWRDMLVTELPLIAANAFDQLSGGNASQGVVPRLTPEAIAAEQQMLHEISDRWHGYLDDRKRLEVTLELGIGGPRHGPEREAWEQSIRDKLEEINAKMLTDLDAVVAHDCDPGNWSLTAEQRALLPEEWRERFERKGELEAAVADGRASASAQRELAALKAEMSAEAGSLYEYGPEVLPEDQHAASPPPQYGPPSPEGR